MNIEAYAAIGILIFSFIGFIWRISYMLNRKVSYESFDRHKKDVTDNYVHKEIFDLTYDQVKADIKEIKDDLKILLRRTNKKGKS